MAHNFENATEGIVVAYHRDRGEDLVIKEHESVNGFVKSDVEEYGYIFTAAGEWLFANGHVGSYDREAVLLESVLVKEAE